jgi:hypothetical protein
MYDPKTARFLQEDTYTGDSNDPLSLNLYTYCANSPLVYYDPTGHNWMDSAREWFLNDTAAGQWVDKNIVKPVENKAKDIYNYVDEKAPALTGIAKAIYDEAKTITDSVDIVDKAMDAVKVITHPKETIKQIGNSYKKLGEMIYDYKNTWKTVSKGVTDYVDTNIINGSAHTRAELGTHAVLFVGSFFVGAGEAKAGANASKLIKGSEGIFTKAEGLTSRFMLDETGSTSIFNKMFGGLGSGIKDEVQVVNRGIAGVSKVGGKPEVFVRYGSEAEAMASKEGLVPKIQNGNPTRGGKWISEKSQPRDIGNLGKPQNYTHEITIETKPGTKQWLESNGIDYENMIGGESKNTGNVFLKSNELGSYGIGADLLNEFNNNWVTKITNKKIR